MRLRLVTGVGAAAIVVGAVWLGAPLLTLLALIGGGLAIREVYRLTPPTVGRMPAALGVTAVVALLLAAETAKGSDFHLASGLVLLGWLFAAVLWFIAIYTGPQSESKEFPVDVPDDEPQPESSGEKCRALFLLSGRRARLFDGSMPSRVESEQERDPDEEYWESIEDSLEEPEGFGQRPWLAFLFLVLGPVYVGFLLGHGLALRDLSGDGDNLGRSWLLFTLLVVFACDTGAYAIGRLLGRHRMAPKVSPNKTWEGAAGGFIASIGVALLVGVVFDLGLPLWQQAMVGAVASVAAQLGDLAESSLKRAANVKDSGSIMPGHGGILDRLDSILFALPAVYYLLLAAGFRL